MTPRHDGTQSGPLPTGMCNKGHEINVSCPTKAEADAVLTSGAGSCVNCSVPVRLSTDQLERVALWRFSPDRAR